ncbi:MAG: ABC transporter substrate-binding protein [Treponema sp.]|jgi:peptide/nickel transport system substrate-binding protein|nr:ABC transporter substrate-binding protein [Treponema sp.]
MKKTSLSVLAGLILFTVAAATAGAGPKSDTASGGQPTGQPRDGGQLIIALAAIPRSLDPIQYTGVYESDIIGNVADTLVRYTMDLSEIIPNIATSWTVSANGIEYTFKLRDDVYFHNGRKLTADDVKFSLERSAKNSAMNRLSMLDRVDVISPTEVRCILKAANAAFVTALTDQGNVIIPKEEVDRFGDKFGTALVGSGPFVLKEWHPDESVVLARNDRYWGPRPHLDGIIYRFITDNNMMATALRSGEIHIATDLNGENIKVVQDAPNVIYKDVAGLQISYFYFNLQKGPTQDIRVRRAILSAIDVDEMVRGLYRYGQGQRAYIPLPPGSWGYDKNLESTFPAYNPREAKRLLAEAGYPNGFDTEIYITDNEVRINAATIIQKYLKDNLNINVQIRTAEWGPFSAIGAGGNAPIYGMSWTWYPDPYFFLNNLFHSSQIGSLGNGQGFKMAEMDTLLDTASSVSALEERARYYKQALKLASEQLPMLVYVNEKATYGFSPKVQGFVLRADKKNTFVSESVNVWLSE